MSETLTESQKLIVMECDAIGSAKEVPARIHYRSDGQIVRTEERFWKKVEKGDGGACWEWKGNRHPFGYGAVRIKDVLYKAHRVSWEWANGPIPCGMCLLHICDNPCCVRPDHLRVGTKKENTHDMMRKGRQKLHGPKGERSSFAKLKESDVRDIRKMYGTGKFTQKQIGDIYGITQPGIGMIVRRENWAHVL